MTTRFYLWPDSGPRRIAAGRHDKYKYPQFAGQRVRRIECSYQFDGDVLHYYARGFFYDFNDDGRVNIMNELRAAMNAAHGGAKADTEKSRELPRLAVVRAGAKAKTDYAAGHTWEPSEDDCALIEADLFGTKRIPLLRGL
ncbi:MAG TPA: hypothetical protein VGQ63_13725 [Pseudolabrys sp.]|nr:hypothetical protein [Pseudolabrys sp.]